MRVRGKKLGIKVNHFKKKQKHPRKQSSYGIPKKKGKMHFWSLKLSQNLVLVSIKF